MKSREKKRVRQVFDYKSMDEYLSCGTIPSCVWLNWAETIADILALKYPEMAKRKPSYTIHSTFVSWPENFNIEFSVLELKIEVETNG